MPNQRHADKRKVGVWLDPKEWDRLEELARTMDVSKSEILKIAIKTDGKKFKFRPSDFR